MITPEPEDFDKTDKLFIQHKPGEPLPGNRTPGELAHMIRYMAASHSSFGWAPWLYWAANTILHFSTPATEAAWRAKYGPNCFVDAPEHEKALQHRNEGVSVLETPDMGPQPARGSVEFSARSATPRAAPPKPARAVLAQTGKAIAQAPTPAVPAPARAKLKKPEQGFF